MKVFILIAMLGSFSSVFGQNDCFDWISKQALTIDSLTKVTKRDSTTISQINSRNTKLVDSVNLLKNEKSELESFGKQKLQLENSLRSKSDSIDLLKKLILERDNLLLTEINKGNQKANEEYTKGKNDILLPIIHLYKNRPFDEILLYTTLEASNRALLLNVNDPAIRQTLSNLLICQSGFDLLNGKFDPAQAQIVKSQLDQINLKSTRLIRLKKNITDFSVVNNAFLETVNKIIEVDRIEVVGGMIDEVKKKKLSKILLELSRFTFNYEFNFSDYPYLSNILLDIIIRKHPDPDADISDLLKKI